MIIEGQNMSKITLRFLTVKEKVMVDRENKSDLDGVRCFSVCAEAK